MYPHFVSLSPQSGLDISIVSQMTYLFRKLHVQEIAAQRKNGHHATEASFFPPYLRISAIAVVHFSLSADLSPIIPRRSLRHPLLFFEAQLFDTYVLEV